MVHIELGFYFVSENSDMEEMATESRKGITQGRKNTVDNTQ